VGVGSGAVCAAHQNLRSQRLQESHHDLRRSYHAAPGQQGSPMSARPDVWFPLVIGDYLKDTMRLTTEQHGAYLLLLMEYWTAGPLPDDDALLGQIARLESKKWKKNRPFLERYFVIENGHWRNRRSDEERILWSEKKRLFSERASAAGRASAAKRGTSSGSSSARQDQLARHPPSPSTEVEGSKKPSTLCGKEAFSDLKDEEGDPMERLRAIIARQLETVESTNAEELQPDVSADGHSDRALPGGMRPDEPRVRGQLPDRRQA